MTRLDVISSYINSEDKVIDVGCDMALLGRKLAKRGIYSIASDINESIITKAFSSTPDTLKKYIDFRVGNGVTLKENEVGYTLVLAGMGTHTILDIIKNVANNLNKIITVSNNNYYNLRKNMNALGYKILSEEIIKEKNKYYNLIIFIKGKETLNEEELIIGKNHKNKELLKEYNDYLINKYSKIKNNYNNKKLVDVINTLSNYVY